VNQAIVTRLLVPFAAMAVVAAVAAWVFLRRSAAAESGKSGPAQTVPLRNPFSLTEASKFGALFAFVLLVVKLVEIHFPGQGLYVVAVLAGLTDVDAITLSMANYAKSGDPDVAVNAIVLAALSNTVTKCAMVGALGGPALRRLVFVATGVILVAGVAAILVL